MSEISINQYTTETTHYWCIKNAPTIVTAAGMVVVPSEFSVTWSKERGRDAYWVAEVCGMVSRGHRIGEIIKLTYDYLIREECPAWLLDAVETSHTENPYVARIAR